MYPDRATFQWMVKSEPNLSGAGKETLLALYDGPLPLRQILDIINTPGQAGRLQDGDAGKPDNKNITESALRKRLELLITRGIIARAGSERTNPYYYIRRPWIFNQYILIKCQEGPSKELLDLTILLHELSNMAGEATAVLPHPRYISAAGERTERSHQIEMAYQAFRKILGNKTAIGDYLEGVYEDIYQGKVPSSDIDGLIARDFLMFVATSPDNEREVRLFLWFAGFFHTLNRYQEAYDAYMQGIDLAGKAGIDLPAILADARVSRGDLLLRLNDPSGAKEAFLGICRRQDAASFARAKGLFGAGEVELICGDLALPYAPTRFTQALQLCREADPRDTDPDVQELKADITRRLGTVHRMSGKLDEAEVSYTSAEAIYTRSETVRGLAWLLPERAELLRARAYALEGPAAEKFLGEAASAYEKGKTVAQKIRSINWFAHCLIGECELARIAYQRCKKPLPQDLGVKFANAFEIYCQISSHWGIAQTFISEALLYHAAPGAFPNKYAISADKLEQAERFCRELGLKPEIALIARIKSGKGTAAELHPLTFI